MSKWEAGIISKDAKYRNTTDISTSGVWGLNEQLRHRNAGNWSQPATTMTDNAGLWINPVSIITTATTSDNTANFSCFAISMDDAIAVEGDEGRLYFAVQVTANTTYYNDFAIGAVQALSDDGDTGHDSTAWHLGTAIDYSTWQTFIGSTSYTTLSSVSGVTWSSIGFGNATKKWNAATSTSSNNTGAADGVNINTGDAVGNMWDTYSLSLGNNDAQAPQVSSTNYIYAESSSSTAHTYIWCRSPVFTMPDTSGVVLVVAYHACTINTSAGMVNTSDEHLLTAWWDGV